MFRQFPDRWRVVTLRGAAVLMMLALPGCALRPLATGGTSHAQVVATEQGFAKSMADRNFAAFQAYLSAEAVFFTGPEPLRGKSQVALWWARYYKDAAAPFSWAPDRVEVLESGTLALSTGPVLDPNGRLIGRFASIWRQEKSGVWRIVFDRGESVPPPAASQVSAPTTQH
jgi:ketosteroid isomerase-like protein